MLQKLNIRYNATLGLLASAIIFLLMIVNSVSSRTPIPYESLFKFATLSLLFGIGGFLGGVLFDLNTGRRQKRIEAAEEMVKAEPQKAKPAWDLARLTLEQYFNRNLNQITWIFWLSLLVMFAGFGVIMWGIQQGIAIAESKENLNSIKSLPPIIAAFSGIITEFIGATFLFIYRSTMQQATNYSKTLERINSVGMAMQILDTMPDESKPGDLKNETKAELVKLLVKGANEQKEVKKEKMERKG
jgi:hypothetical protein